MVRNHPADHAFDALADPDRRQLLFALLTTTPADPTLDPVDPVIDDPTTGDHTATRLQLQHMHLPKLAEMGVIDWDGETDTVAKGPHWDDIAPLLRVLHDHRDELPDDWLSELSPET